jgi:hypothetical protein
MNDLNEFRNYRFRVPLPDGRGPMHFATHLDALTFADASMDAERIEFNSGTLENPCWEILKVYYLGGRFRSHGKPGDRGVLEYKSGLSMGGWFFRKE